jgi:hypothetical protein
MASEEAKNESELAQAPLTQPPLRYKLKKLGID